jgi:hypothetical protein
MSVEKCYSRRHYEYEMSIDVSLCLLQQSKLFM